MISQEPPQDAIAPFPVLPGITALYGTLFRHIQALVARLVLPTVISAVVLLLLTFQLPPFAAIVVWYLFLAVPFTLFGVSWLRLLLLEEETSPFAAFADFDARHRRLLKYNFLLSLITLPLVVLQYWLDAGGEATAGADEAYAGAQSGDAVIDLVYWAAYMPLFYVQLRLSFVLPAIAVDERYGFADSWRHTRSQSGQIFLVAVIAVLGPWLVWYYSPSLSDDSLWQLFAFFFYHFSIFLHQGAFFALMAIAFRTCTGWVPPANRSLVERFE